MSGLPTTGPTGDIKLIKNLTSKDTNSDKAKNNSDNSNGDLNQGLVIFVMIINKTSFHRFIGY